MTDSKLPQHITTPSDRFWLKFTRTLPASEIGSEVSIVVMEKAMNRRRIGFNVGICILAGIGFLSYIARFKKEREEKVKVLYEENP